jgi:mono/diheme cytochrome c family protein
MVAALGLTVASAAFGIQSAGGDAKAGAVAPVAPDAAKIAKGRELFTNWSCNSCHSLADANAEGHVGPSFDGNAGLTVQFVTSRVTDGQGAMPAFGGQMTDEEIATIAAYIVAVHK